MVKHHHARITMSDLSPVSASRPTVFKDLGVKHNTIHSKFTHNLLPTIRSRHPLRKSISHSLILTIRAHQCMGGIKQDLHLVFIFTLHLDHSQYFPETDL